MGELKRPRGNTRVIQSDVRVRHFAAMRQHCGPGSNRHRVVLNTALRERLLLTRADIACSRDHARVRRKQSFTADQDVRNTRSL